LFGRGRKLVNCLLVVARVIAREPIATAI